MFATCRNRTKILIDLQQLFMSFSCLKERLRRVQAILHHSHSSFTFLLFQTWPFCQLFSLFSCWSHPVCRTARSDPTRFFSRNVCSLLYTNILLYFIAANICAIMYEASDCTGDNLQIDAKTEMDDIPEESRKVSQLHSGVSNHSPKPKGRLPCIHLSAACILLQVSHVVVRSGCIFSAFRNASFQVRTVFIHKAREPLFRMRLIKSLLLTTQTRRQMQSNWRRWI